MSFLPRKTDKFYRHRRQPAVLFAVFFWIGFFPRGACALDTAFARIYQVAKKQDQTNLEGIKITVFWWNDAMSVETAHIFKKAKAERFDFFPSKGHGYQNVVIRDPWVYHANPAKHLAYRTPYEMPDPYEDTILGLAAQNYSWIDEGEDTVANLPARRIAAVLKQDPSQTVARFWVDAAHPIILRQERYNSRGFPSFFSSFLTVDFTKTIPDSVFEFDPMQPLKNVPVPQELEGEAALKALHFKPLVPQWIPGGFALVGTYSTRWGAYTKLQWRYSDGLRNFSVYENPRRGSYRPLRNSTLLKDSAGRSFELVESPEGKLVRFGRGNLTAAVIGNIPLKTAMKIGENIGASKPAAPIRRLWHYFRKGLMTLKRFF